MNQVHLFRYKWGSRPTETNWSKSSENSVSGAIFCMHLGIKKKKKGNVDPCAFSTDVLKASFTYMYYIVSIPQIVACSAEN